MKVLFFVRHYTYLRNFESVLRQLLEQGHEVHVAAERDEAFGGREMIDRLMAIHPTLTLGDAPARADGWYGIATKVRLGLDYLRYLQPAYDSTPKLRARAEERVAALFLTIARLPMFRGESGRARLLRWFTAL